MSNGTTDEQARERDADISRRAHRAEAEVDRLRSRVACMERILGKLTVDAEDRSVAASASERELAGLAERDQLRAALEEMRADPVSKEHVRREYASWEATFRELRERHEALRAGVEGALELLSPGSAERIKRELRGVLISAASDPEATRDTRPRDNQLRAFLVQFFRGVANGENIRKYAHVVASTIEAAERDA
jgi:DNA primase large subunit